jgi:flagella basal body P-ring formation protein FlgA
LVLLAALLLASPLPAQEVERSGVAARTPRAMPAGSMRMSLAVATRALTRGDTIRANDFTLVDSTITWRWSMPSADTVAVQPGWVAQRAIAAGEVLRTPSVQPPAVVSGGSVVKVIFRDGPVQIVLSGTAITSATLGAPVAVRIDRTRRIEGIAVAPNTVRIR